MSLAPDVLASLAGEYAFQADGAKRTLIIRFDGSSLMASGPSIGPPTGERSSASSAMHPEQSLAR